MVALAELPRVCLRPFEFGRRTRRAECGHSCGGESVDDAVGDRRVGADQREVDALVSTELDEVGASRNTDSRGAGVAGGHEQCIAAWRTRCGPCHRVLTPTGDRVGSDSADHENSEPASHASTCSNWPFDGCDPMRTG